MKARSLSLIATMVFGIAAQASHPHDTVCTGSALVQDHSPVEILFQYEVERSYEKGNSNEDPHIYTFQLRNCFSDYDSDTCKIYRDKKKISSSGFLKKIPLTLKNSSEGIFFQGNLIRNDQGAEILVGEMSIQPDDLTAKPEMITVTVPLTCVGQPLLKF